MTPQHPASKKPAHTSAQGNRTIGSLLRDLRAGNGWTLKEMSERCGIPLSTLSKVEHDRLTLTYDKLQQISQRLNMRMSELFAEQDPDDEPPITARRSIGRIEDAVRVTTPNYDYYYLCPELRRKRMIPVLTRVRARNLDEFGALVHHSGEEYIHVLEGEVAIHTEFYDTIVLGAGEGVYIDSNMGHAYTTAEGCEEAVLLGICSSADDQLLESLMTLHGDETPTTVTAPSQARRLAMPSTEAAKSRPRDRRKRASPAAGRKSKPAN